MTEDRRPAQDHPAEDAAASRDAALERVRAADPAARLEPDLTALDAAVRARIAARGVDLDEVDEVAVARARRRSRGWLPIAAAAAGALVFASAGYALGDRGGDGAGPGGAQDAAGAAISLGQGSANQSTVGTTSPEAAKVASDSARSGAGMVYPGYSGRTVFTASGLSDDAGSATAWAFDPAPVFSAATANAAASALGLDGQAVLVDGAWTVGPVDGSGPSISLQPDALASLSYYNPGLDAYACQSAAGSSDTTTQPNPLPEPAQTCAPTDATPAPQGDAAIARAKEVLGSIGLDTDAFEYEVQETGTAQASYVNAFQVVDGQRTGSSAGVNFVGSGLQALNGSLAHVVPLGSYDVVSPTAAVARLGDPRFGSSYGGPMYAMAEGALADDSATARSDTAAAPDATSQVAPAPERTLPPTAQPGTAFRWPVEQVALTSARLGLTMSVQADGATVLLPAYELSNADGRSWSVVAVADAQLDFSAAP